MRFSEAASALPPLGEWDKSILFRPEGYPLAHALWMSTEALDWFCRARSNSGKGTKVP